MDANNINDPEVQRALHSGLNRTLGFDITEASADRVVMSWTVGPEHLQPYGIVHGGVYCAAVEATASIGAALWLDDRGQVVGVANQTDFLRATTAGRLTATATPIHRGRSQQLWLVEIAGDDGRLAARGQVRLQNLAGQSMGPTPGRAHSDVAATTGDATPAGG